MPDTLLDVEQKTRVHVSQALGIGLVTLFGAAAAAAFLFFGSSKATTTTAPVSQPKASTSTDYSGSKIPETEILAASSTTTTAPTTLDPTVSVVITSPQEGAAVNGNAQITVALTDPNNRVEAVRVLLYGAMLPEYLQGVSLGTDREAPYTFATNYGLYPSAEYRYVAQAVRYDSSIPGADTAVVLATNDTMVTWVRSCYYLGYQEMTLTAPTAPVTPGSTVSLTGTVKNINRGNCQHVYSLNTFNPISSSSWLPEGWSGTITPEQATIGINTTQAYTLTVTVPATATPGTYTVGASSKLQYTGFIATQSAEVIVVAGGANDTPTEGEIIPVRR